MSLALSARARWQALHSAAMNDAAEAACVLLAAGADLRAEDQDGETAEEGARRRGRRAAADLLAASRNGSKGSPRATLLEVAPSDARGRAAARALLARLDDARRAWVPPPPPAPAPAPAPAAAAAAGGGGGGGGGGGELVVGGGGRGGHGRAGRGVAHKGQPVLWAQGLLRGHRRLLRRGASPAPARTRQPLPVRSRPGRGARSSSAPPPRAAPPGPRPARDLFWARSRSDCQPSPLRGRSGWTRATTSRCRIAPPRTPPSEPLTRPSRTPRRSPPHPNPFPARAPSRVRRALPRQG